MVKQRQRLSCWPKSPENRKYITRGNVRLDLCPLGARRPPSRTKSWQRCLSESTPCTSTVVLYTPFLSYRSRCPPFSRAPVITMADVSDPKIDEGRLLTGCGARLVTLGPLQLTKMFARTRRRRTGCSWTMRCAAFPCILRTCIIRIVTDFAVHCSPIARISCS